MKYFLLISFCVLASFASTAQLTLTMDASCTAPGATGARITGPWWGWDPNAGPAATDNGDDTWTVTLDPAPTESMEYLWVVDGVQENLISAMVAGGSCAPITDFANYANRQWVLGSGNVSETFNQCDACAPVATGLNLTVEVCDATASSVRITGPWWGWDPNAGPIAADNGDGTWTVTLDPAPTESMEYLWVVDGVQENLVPAMVAGGSCAPITDFANYANRQWVLGSGNVSETFNQCDACAPVSTGVNLTVEVCDVTASSVRMTGPFWAWDPNGGPIAADNGDGTWTVSLDPAPTENMEYLWIVDGVQENLVPAMVAGGACAPITDFVNYANRQWILDSGDVSETYNQCDACGGGNEGTNLLSLTFDDATSITPWVKLADAVGPEASLDWNGTGVATGAIEVSGTNTSDGIGRAYIFEYLNNAMDYAGASSVQLTFDIKASAPLTGASVHLQTEFPGLGTTNTFDIQNQGINDVTWTTLSFDYNNISAGNLFRMHFNIAAGAFIGAGGGLLVDNIQLTSTGTGTGGGGAVALTVEVCGAPASNVRMTGPFWGWDPGAGPVAVDNGDGTWTVTLNPAPTENMEYLWIVDGVQENLIPAMVAGGSCAPITDFANYANRQWILDSGDVSDTFNQCEGCAPALAGCTDSNAANYDTAATEDDGSCAYDVTFSVDMNEYGNTFGFVNVSGTWNAFCADCNPLTDDNLDGIWEATWPIPSGDHQYKFQVDAWSDNEALTQGDACTITIGGFTNRNLAVGTSAQTIPTVCWASCYTCVGAGVPGCTNPEANNYDVAATAEDGSCLYDITFSVDMNQYIGSFTTVEVNGTFNGFCGTCATMTDVDLDGIYDISFEIGEGAYEYKFTLDNFAQQEIFDDSYECVVNNFGFINRFISVTGDQTVPTVCYNSCSACVFNAVNGCTDPAANNYDAAANTDDGSCLYNVSLRVNMNQYLDPFTTVYLSGEFNGWSGGANPMSDVDGDNIWDITVEMPAGQQAYKFQVDEWAAQENFVGGEPCTQTLNGFTNRIVDVNQNNINLPIVCWNSCSACVIEFNLVTFRVDMANETVSPNGVHIAGSFQGWDASSTPMTYLGYGVYTYSIELQAGAQVEYQIINGNDFAFAEAVPAACGADNGLGGFNRAVVVPFADTVLPVHCFGECDACSGCTDPMAVEFNPYAGADNGSCATPVVFGCTYADADNYLASANEDDGSCTFTLGSACPSDFNNDGITNAGDLLLFLSDFGSICE
ncbi:MAG: hypothetical protein P8H98_01730 [Flavobacteriales bacterium]|nr:hypothetical protein [Flavobacteriales bacterium]